MTFDPADLPLAHLEDRPGGGGAAWSAAGWLCPKWAEPGGASALMTGRQVPQPLMSALHQVGGSGALEQGGPYASFNLGDHVGDAGAGVQARRLALQAALGVRPLWLRQVHGRRVVRLSWGAPSAPTQASDEVRPVLVDGVPHHGQPVEADGAWTSEPGLACAVMVADCLPVLLSAPGGQAVAALHAGWRGLCGAGPQMAGQGVIDQGVSAMVEGLGCQPGDLQAWLGPCIGPQAFEVGADVPEAFGLEDRGCFKAHPTAKGTWLADLPALARARLTRLGVLRVSGGLWCTHREATRFYSFRREPITGRQAALIWAR